MFGNEIFSESRKIVLDTETTGLSPKEGHRIIEIGCVELSNQIPSGKEFHCYINPERDVSKITTDITGLTAEFLQPFPVFSKIAQDFLDFIQDSPLIIHNASFDCRFLDAEFERLQIPLINRNRIIDTLIIAKERFPGTQASLDALCRKFKIDYSKRTHHGALLDAKLLSKVYFELLEKKQGLLKLDLKSIQQKIAFPRRYFNVSEREMALHQKWVEDINAWLI